MDSRIKMSEKEMCNYFIREQKVMKYGEEFFNMICSCDMSTENCKLINNEVLPLLCFNQLDEYLYSVDNGYNYAVRGGFVKAVKKQAYIRIGIDASNSILNKVLKRTIRHEIIHYCLWLLDLPHDDDSLEFWCLCYVFDGGAYEELSLEDKKYYDLFKNVYDKYVAVLPEKNCYFIVGQMITSIRKTPMDNFTDTVMDMVKVIKNLYRLE